MFCMLSIFFLPKILKKVACHIFVLTPSFLFQMFPQKTESKRHTNFLNHFFFSARQIPTILFESVINYKPYYYIPCLALEKGEKSLRKCHLRWKYDVLFVIRECEKNNDKKLLNSTIFSIFAYPISSFFTIFFEVTEGSRLVFSLFWTNFC